MSFCRGMISHEGGRGNRNTTQILSSYSTYAAPFHMALMQHNFIRRFCSTQTLMWIIASIEFLAGKGQDFGQTWTLGHLDHRVKGILQWWVAIGIKKLHKEHLVIAKALGLKTIYSMFKPLVQKIWMLCILCALASCCALPLRILRLAHLDHCVKGIVQWRVAIGIKKLHKEHLVIAKTLGLKTTYRLHTPCSNH